MNETQVIGNLGRDATIKESNGKKYISFSLGHSEKYTDQDGVQHEKSTWFSCLKYIKSESKLAQFLKRGTQVYVRGKISSHVYEMDVNGQKVNVSSLDLFVYDLELLGGPRNNDQQTAQPETQQPSQQSVQQQRPQYPNNPAPTNQGQQMNMMPQDDDLPF